MGHKFELTITHPNGKQIKASFQEANGLEPHPRKLRGLRPYSNITLKRGYTDDSSLSDWHSQVKDGKFSKSGSERYIAGRIAKDDTEVEAQSGMACKVRRRGTEFEE
jgi:hypothetical protein